jgi:hypothetical protein
MCDENVSMFLNAAGSRVLVTVLKTFLTKRFLQKVTNTLHLSAFVMQLLA